MASVEEHARQLLALANDAPAGEVAQLIENLQSWGLKAVVIMGDTSASRIMSEYVENALNTCAQLQDAIQLLKDQAEEYGRRYLGN